MKVVLTRSITAAIRLMIAVIIIYMINFDATTTANMIFIMAMINGILMLFEVLLPLIDIRSY